MEKFLEIMKSRSIPGTLIFDMHRKLLFFIHHPLEKKPTHIMIMIEKIIKGHDFDFEKARTEFGLSGREMEVLGLICKGLSNKEISEKLFICEYTAKDHTKNILRKIGV